jgi:hypothetical protein
MRKIGFAKYKDRTKEILPKTYKVDEITCQRRMFCTMINQYLSVQSKLNLNNNHIYENSLLDIFEDKIMSFFQFYKFRPEKSQRIVKVYTQDSLLLNQYFKQSRAFKMRYMSKNIQFNPHFKILLGYAHPAIDLIQLIFNGKEVEMMLDLNEIFTRTVYERIKQEVNKKVTLDLPYIHIDQNGVRTRLYPQWKHVNSDKIGQRNSDIEKGFAQLQNDKVDQCYLVYPKRDNFKRHITIQKDDTQTLKMIPYSFSFIYKQEKKCRR